MTDIFEFIAEIAKLPWFWFVGGFLFFCWVAFYNQQKAYWDSRFDQTNRPWWTK